MMNLRYYREVDKLQDNKDFCIDFETKLLLNLFLQQKHPDNDDRVILHNRLESQLRHINRKSVYVALKWLIFMHQVIRNKPCQQILEEVSGLLDKMTPPATLQRIDQYIAKKLVSPYKQYLRKLSDKVLLGKISYQNCNRLSDSFVYSQYNFINWTLCEFAAPIRQFVPFFSSQYPYLTRFVSLLNADLIPLYKIVLQTFEDNGIGMVTFIQIEKMGSQLSALFGCLKLKEEERLQATADSNSPAQHNPYESNYLTAITPFQSLQCSNLSLIPLRK